MEIITVGLSPNTECDDSVRALCMLFTPWKWKNGTYTHEIYQWFKTYFNTPYITFFSSGRSALTALLSAFGIGDGDEVLLQAFTCMVVPNAIRFTGATARYVDIDGSANIDPSGIEKVITLKTKAIIVQHTFGTPADMDSIMRIAHERRVLVIEDCAHALGAIYKGRKAGTIGDGAIFSFGRDKILSSVFGGAAIVKNNQTAKKLHTIEQKALYPSVGWIAQQLCHPIAASIILPLYASGIGKLLLVILQKLHIVSFPVSRPELLGTQPKNYIQRYPNALAYLLMRQLQKSDRYFKNRQAISSYYERELKKMHIQFLDARETSARLRFGMITNHQEQILLKAKRNNILLGNWYHNVVDPQGSDISKAGYQKRSCPKAELLAKTIINLPTRVTQKQADKVIRIVHSV